MLPLSGDEAMLVQGINSALDRLEAPRHSSEDPGPVAVPDPAPPGQKAAPGAAAPEAVPSDQHGVESADGGSLFVGVDVGTGSARAGVFNQRGEMLGCAVVPIQTWRADIYMEQSSTDIWDKVCAATRAAIATAAASPEQVRGLCFDATCSLVALGEDSEPVSVSVSGADHKNIILWADHRAVKEAEEMNATDHPSLQYVGGKVSPEMELPKVRRILSMS